jgi:hypothetical protein
LDRVGFRLKGAVNSKGFFDGHKELDWARVFLGVDIPSQCFMSKTAGSNHIEVDLLE